jgi:hypothetical protein
LSELASYLPVAVVIVASLSLFWTDHWRGNIAALAMQYLAVFLFVNQSWSTGLSLVKLIAGWMAAAVLSSSTGTGSRMPAFSHFLSARIFRLLAAILIIILSFSIAPTAAEWLPLPPAALVCSLILIGTGLLQLGITTIPGRVIIGLLSVLSGFEVIYAAVVSSVLVAGLLALVTLGIALTGAYWLNLTPSEEQQ